MLSKFIVCVECLEEIFISKKSFKDTTKNLISNSAYNKDEKFNMKALIGSAVRHHIFLSKILKNKCSLKVTDNPKLFFALELYLADTLFVKRYLEQELFKDLLKNYIIVNLIDFDIDAFSLEFKDKQTSTILKDLYGDNSFSNDFLSTRFNVPVWLIKMLTAQYSRSICIKIIKKLASKQVSFIKQNELYHNPNFQLNKTDFSKSEYENIFKFNGKGKLRNYPATIKGSIYPINLIDYLASKDVENTFFGNYCLYFFRKTSLINILLDKFQECNSFGIFSNEFDVARFDFQFIKKANNPKVFHDQIEMSSLSAKLSNKVNLFFLVTESSDFEKVLTNPDYLFNFDINKIDNIIKNEEESLLEASRHIEEEGSLIYITHTLNTKENSLLVASFLKENKDFYLEKELTLFPYEFETTLGYYAILRKKSNGEKND